MSILLMPTFKLFIGRSRTVRQDCHYFQQSLGMGHDCRCRLLVERLSCPHVRSAASVGLDLYFERLGVLCRLLCYSRNFRSGAKRSASLDSNRQSVSMSRCPTRRASFVQDGHGGVIWGCRRISDSGAHQRRFGESHLHVRKYPETTAIVLLWQ